MKLNPAEMHKLKIMVDYELEKKKCEQIVLERIDQIVEDYLFIMFEKKYNPQSAWEYDGKDLWASLGDDGRIYISSRFWPPLTSITQNMLVSDNWKEELKKQNQKND